MAELKYTLTRAINGVRIEQRKIDGYIDATAMCKAHGKLFPTYRQNASSQQFLEALALNIGIPIIDLAQSTPGRYGRSWVHPRVALHLAQWCSPEFAVLVTAWIDEWSAQPLFQEQVREQAPLIAPVIEQIGNPKIESRIAQLEAKVIDLAHQRVPFSPATRKRVGLVVLRCYGGIDPAGSTEKITDDRGNFLPRIAELDHFNGNRRDNHIENCFPMHESSHKKKTRGHDFSPEFRVFHTKRLMLEDRERQQPDLFGPPKGGEDD